MHLSSSGLVEPGPRPAEQEGFALSEPELGLFVACDGIRGGREATETVAQAMADLIQQKTAVFDSLLEDSSERNRTRAQNVVKLAVETANARVFQKRLEGGARKELAASLDAVLVCEDRAFIAHVGHGRVYLLRGGKCHRLTEEHLFGPEQVRRGLMTQEEASKSPKANVLTRAIGVTEAIEVDCLEVEINPGDAFLLASAGVWTTVPPTELPRFTEGARAADAAVTELVRAAKAKQAAIGHTALLVRCLLEPPTAGAGRPQAAPSPASGRGPAAPLPIAPAAGARPSAGASPRPPGGGLSSAAKSELVGGAAVFKYLNYAEIQKVLNISTLREFQPGEVLFAEGSEADEMLLIASGSVEILKGDQVIAQEGKGKLLGEMGLFDRQPRSATIRAAQVTQALSFLRDPMLALIRRESQLAVKFFWALVGELTDRLRATNETLAMTKVTAGQVPKVPPPFGDDWSHGS